MVVNCSWSVPTEISHRKGKCGNVDGWECSHLWEGITYRIHLVVQVENKNALSSSSSDQIIQTSKPIDKERSPFYIDHDLFHLWRLKSLELKKIFLAKMLKVLRVSNTEINVNSKLLDVTPKILLMLYTFFHKSIFSNNFQKIFENYRADSWAHWTVVWDKVHRAYLF